MSTREGTNANIGMQIESKMLMTKGKELMRQEKVTVPETFDLNL